MPFVKRAHFLNLEISCVTNGLMYRTCRIQPDDRSLQYLLCLLHYNGVSLCRGFATTHLATCMISLRTKEEESTRTLVVLDFDA